MIVDRDGSFALALSGNVNAVDVAFFLSDVDRVSFALKQIVGLAARIFAAVNVEIAPSQSTQGVPKAD